MRRKGRSGELEVSVAASTLAVIRTNLRSVTLVVPERVIELRCVLDLVLRAVDEDLLVLVIDVPKHAHRQQHFLAEDPRTGVDNDVSCIRFEGRIVDLAD